MWKDGVVLAVVVLIVAGGLFLWWTQTPTHYGAPVADTQVQPPEPAPKPAPVVKARPKPKKEEPVVEQALGNLLICLGLVIFLEGFRIKITAFECFKSRLLELLQL